MKAAGRACSGLPLLLPLLVGCSGMQSALDPAGSGAREIARLWWVMAAAALVIFMLVLGMAAYATVASPERHERFPRHLLIIGGGVALPVALLSLLLGYSFSLGRELVEAPADALEIEVVGKQWWWEVRYPNPEGGEPVVGANELHIPAGRPVELVLSSSDVIHSFWVPRLAGKRDMVPGRVNRLRVDVDEPGVHRGQCAEYCGGPHALMAFYVVAHAPEDFTAWLAREARPAQEPGDPFLRRGRDLFIESGCGACHSIRGTPASGAFGPDLTHVGGRMSLAAGILPNNVGTLAGWIADTAHVKPGNKMPAFNTFAGEELRAIAAYLASLR